LPGAEGDVLKRGKVIGRVLSRWKEPAIFLCLIVAGLSSVCAAPSHTCIPLEGLHRFKSGDNPEWVAPAYDDSRWRLIQVPGSWQSQGIRPQNGMGWYRIHFKVSEELKDIPAGVSLGLIGNACQVFLNGTEIGGEGVIGDHFVYAPYMQVVYRIPEGLLRYGHTNILSVRVMNIFFGGGIVSGRIIIDDYRNLALEKIRRESVKKTAELVFLSILCLFLSACVLLYGKSRKEKDYAYFGLVLLTYLVFFGLDSLIFYETGLKTYLVQKVSLSVLAFMPAAFLLFFVHFFKEPPHFLFRIIAYFSAALSIGCLAGISHSTFAIFFLLWLILISLFAAASIFLSVRAYLRGLNESGPILLGTAGFCLIGSAGDIASFFKLGGLNVYYPLYPWDYGMVFFLSCLMYAMISRFVRTRDRMKALSSRILTAYEKERKRLSRELHDGLGQSLLAVKFNLQRTNRDMRNSLVEGVISELSGGIDELRNILMGLRPPLLDERGIEAALKIYGRRFSEKTGIDIDVRVDLHRRPPLPVEENLFRIFQEALSNIARHSGAKRGVVSLSDSDGLLVMAIEDDGTGFDSRRKSDEGACMGLSTMEERAELMDGNLTITSKKGKGTAIRVQISV